VSLISSKVLRYQTSLVSDPSAIVGRGNSALLPLSALLPTTTCERQTGSSARRWWSPTRSRATWRWFAGRAVRAGATAHALSRIRSRRRRDSRECHVTAWSELDFRPDRRASWEQSLQARKTSYSLQPAHWSKWAIRVMIATTFRQFSIHNYLCPTEI